VCNKLYHTEIIYVQNASKIVKKISKDGEVMSKIKMAYFFYGTHCSVDTIRMQQGYRGGSKNTVDPVHRLAAAAASDIGCMLILAVRR